MGSALRISLYLASVLLVAGAVFSLWCYRELTRPYKGYSEAEKLIQIERGSSKRDIARQLEREGIISHRTPMLIYLWLVRRGATLKAGEYLFAGPASQLEVCDKLIRGEAYLHRVTVPEGLTLSETAAEIASSGLVALESLLQAMLDPAPVLHIDPQAKDLEGYLFPETYYFPRGVTARDMMRAMVARFEQVFDQELRRRSREAGLSIREAVILASLVEKETAREEERPLVAAVFLNRLRSGLRLECDPTIIYALTRKGLYRGQLSKKDLLFESPYNTYLNPGLPPGPICSPGLSSLRATLYPADTRFLYFVSKNDGTHFFSEDYRQHQRAVAKYRKLRAAAKK